MGEFEGVSPALATLAVEAGVDTTYEGVDGHLRRVPASTLRAVLGVLGADASDDAAATAATERLRRTRRERILPATHVVDAEAPGQVPLSLPLERVAVHLETEDGGRVDLDVGTGPAGAPGSTGDARRQVRLPLPHWLPLGYHRLTVTTEGGSQHGTLVVGPRRCPLPADLPRVWGWMLQLYALRSAQSWGIGDLADLGRLLEWTAARDGHFAVVNPLHAQVPVSPVQPSPYFPASRRFHDPLTLAVGEVPEITTLEPDEREQVIALGAQAMPDASRIDRDAVLDAKLSALAAGFASLGPGRAAKLARFRERGGQALEDFATFCAIAERHGVPFRQWPAELQHPARSEVEAFRAAHADRVAFHAWLQMLCDEQLARTQNLARTAGMRLGVIHDLAVGVDAGGADAWAMQDELGLGVTVGAPPDAFNQQGQDWAQPPLIPSRLPETGFAPFREMLAAVLRHAGGIRIDHVLGLFRLFWIPEGADPADGAYVRYPADDLLGILALEAHRAGAVVVGEDLGTVEEGVRDTLDDRRVLRSSVLYFERDEDDPQRPRAPEAYPERALASVTTHDLPTATGWWADEDVRVRAELDLLGEQTSPDDEQAAKARDRESLRALLEQRSLVGDDAGRADLVVAMHAYLARTPALLVAANLADAVGDLRQPNLPGTVEAYPNWRLPIAEPVSGGHRELSLEEILAHPLLARVVDALRSQRHA